ncbi:MAG: hypothetical protein IJ888_08480 [Prevotella sp.]|nr:hypothetical protein [Prevotella sp.]
MKHTRLHIIRIFTLLLLLLAGGTANEAWAAKVTYHILTLPIDNTIYKMKSGVNGKRLEAVKIIVDQTAVELPAHYKSPLAENFKYYETKDITGHGGSAVSLYDDVATCKGVLYEVKGDATEVKEGSAITGSTAEYYVVYTYKTSNTIAKLDGTVNYNIGVKGKGFLSLNRGRNNRPAVIPTAKVDAVMLASEDFSYVANPGNGIGTYWSSGDNKNVQADVESQFFFGFNFVGQDPYNIIIRTSYNRDITFIEKNEGTTNFVYKWYKGAALMAKGDGNVYLASDDHKQYTATYSSGSANPTDPARVTNTGYFHGNDCTWGTVALLNNTSTSRDGYVLLGTRTVDGNGAVPTPGNDNKYNYLTFNGYNNMNFKKNTAADATKNNTIDGIYPLKKVTFKVVTPFYKVSPTTDHIVSAPTEWVSQYTVDNEDIDTKYLPTSLLRKYCTYTGFYRDPACTQEITKFSGANYDPTEGYQVYIGYEVSANIPFKAITPAASYTDDTWKAATWYAMTDRDSSGKKIKWDSTNSVYKNNGGASENVKESEFAFIGDPYELRVVYRNETSGATATYVGSDLRTTETDLTKNTSDAGAGYKWEISYDEETKNNAFQLREYKGTAYWYWNSSIEGSNIQYSTTNTDRRIRVLPLPEKSCNFYIVDTYNTIAIKATVNRTVFSPLLGYASIPEEIRSPFIYGETITFYSDAACTTSITETSNTDNYNIYVKYTLAHLSEKGIQLNSDQRFKVKLNKEYIYYNSSSSKILSAETTGGDEYSWSLEGGDPYAMKIANKSLSGKYVKVDGGTWGNDKALTFVNDIENPSRFIAMSSLYTGIYEVLAATGDANYYHIGRPTESGAETRIYSVNTAGYAHGAETLQFELSGDVPITYHLIDRANNELLTAKSFNPRLTLPAEYVSPLVEEYYYYPTRAKALTNLERDRITELKDDTDNEDNKPGDNEVYVTYVANDIVNFNKGQYMLKFLDPAIPEYHLEDGNDKLTASKIQPIYPYCNGDGNLNIYGDEMQTEQFGGGANTRPRWVWYFESSNSDPYHVRIHSKSTISYNEVSHYTYLTTHAVHFNQDTGVNSNKKRVVTGGTLPTIASITPTEYMVLGTKGNYRLLTTNTIPVDLNNDGDTDDEGESNERQSVTTLEQYWKTYNMIKKHVLGINVKTDPTYADAYSDDESTWVVPEAKRTELLTAQPNWHSYDAYANATRWNGFNDKSDGHDKKVVEKIEHWYQTFNMGTGVFDIETADIPPVLVLLDRHGWEVMRRPLPGASTYPAGDELKDLRMYDSPLVDKYYFYSNATKASGCHKYTMRLQNGAERDQVKVNGERYYSTSLGDLPPKTAVVSGGAIQDLYVIYTVKEEYENNYDYDLNENTSPYTESGTSKPYLVLQHGRFYKTENTKATDFRSYFTKPIREHTNLEDGNVYDLIVNPKNHGGTNDNILSGSNFIGNIFWYVEPNLNIDDEMGIPWMKATGEDTETAAKNKLRKDYKDKTGFDPYNIQLRLKNKNDGTTDGRYLTTHMTSTTLDNGIWVGEYNSMTATDVTDVETQAKKLSKTGKYYFKQKDAENYWLVNVTVAYDGSTDATFTKTEGSYATEWTQQSYKLTLEEACTSPITSEGYDHSEMQITNQTFMAVSDVNGNMQLMPRFDHTKRVHLPGTEPWHTTLSDPEDHALASVEDNSSMGPQTTFFVTPQRFHYHIIDNNGREALRYKRGADTYPTITDHFKSPLATNFTYYKGLAEGTIEDSNEGEWATATGDFKRTLTDKSIELSDVAKLLPTKGTYYYRLGARGDFSWKKVTVAEGKGLLDKQITGSFAVAKLEGSADDVDYPVYVRYEYDEDADHDGDHILQGRWFTVKLADKDLQASGTVAKTVGETQGTGVSLYKGENSSRSLTATNSTDLDAQADKLTETGDYYFRVGTNPSYTYYKVTVTTAYTGSTDAVHTDDLDDGSKGYETLWSNSKPLVIDADAKKWQWKFFVAPTDPSSDYYTEPDPYAVILFNRQANYTTNPSENPSPMGIGIKVPNANDGANRFALLGHPEGGYALAVAKAYDDDRDYEFVNGGSMTLPSTTAATTATEANFTYKTGTITSGARLVLNDDVTHNFTYYVITNDGKLAITATQDNDEADSHGYAPSLPESAQSKLLNLDDYLYYGFAARDINGTPEDPSDDTYSVIVYSILTSLSSLYDDVVYVRYPETFDSSKTPYYVPNKKDTSSGHVARHDDSNDVAIDINGKLPYNIIWYNDNMMASDGSTISDGGSQTLTGGANYTWYFDGGDPYALHIYKKSANKYIDASAGLSSTPQDFMLLKKDGYDYGVFAKTGDKDNMLSFGTLADPSGAHTLSISKTAPNKFVPFALSTHKLVYHLIINTSNVKTTIPYRTGDEEHPSETLGETDILGTTQRDLTSQSFGIPGDKYQLGHTYMGQTYCVDAGQVSIGDSLAVPNEFSRPNCSYYFYIDNIQTAGLTGTYQKTVSSESEMETGIAALAAVGDYYYKITGQYIYRKVKVTTANDGVNNAVYEISGSTASEYSGASSSLTATDAADLKTKADALNATGDYYYAVGPMDLYKRAHVTSVSPVVSTVVDCTNDEWANCWQDNTDLNNLYKGLKVTKLMSKTDLVGSLVKVNVEYRMATLDTNAGDDFITEMKPAGEHYLWYTFETAESTPQLAHYTIVRRMRAESGRALHYTNDFLWAPLGDPYGFRSFNRYAYKNNGQSEYVLTTASIADNQEVVMGSYESNDKRDIYELLESSTPGNGTFRVHPLLNTDNTIFLRVKESVDPAENGKLILSDDKPVQEWIYGLSEQLLNPYYQGAGNVGGLNDDGKTAYETAKTTYADNPARLIRELQQICYNKDNIVNYAAGYYRLANQPGASSISPQRYASGYLHLVESTDYDGNSSADADGDENNAIDVLPMHFYSRKGISTTFEGDGGLTTGFTKSIATQGDIPVPATENDASTIFQFSGTATAATMKTQDLYVMGVETNPNEGYAKMTDTPGSATTFHVDDVGGAVVIIYNLDGGSRRHYLNYKQGDAAHIYDLHYYENVDVDASKWSMVPADTMVIATNNGGDGYYYATFYAPFDVTLPANKGEKTYNAYVCNEWHTEAVHPVAVPARTISEDSYEEGKFVPGGTPVIIRVKDETGKITLTLPTATPSSSLSCVFTGEYLEQLLAPDPSNDVYTLGVPMTSTVDSYNKTTGVVVAPLPEFATSGVGFYINATPNKEADDDQASWQRNNRYVLHNKIYYREEPSPSRELSMRGIEFVPIIFDNDEEGGEQPGEEEQNPSEGATFQGDGCIYDMMGRKVATRQQVEDGSWRLLRPGIYILNGKKFRH